METKPVLRHLPTIARLLLGFIFVLFGLNGLLNFLPAPTAPMPERAIAFVGALAATGYMFPLIKITEIIAGALLLSNRHSALALTLLAPIIVNIVAFHVLLAPSGAAVAVVVLVLEIYLAWTYRSVFRPVLAAHVKPRAAEREPSNVAAHASA